MHTSSRRITSPHFSHLPVFLPDTSKVADFLPKVSHNQNCRYPTPLERSNHIPASHNAAMKETSDGVFGKSTKRWEDDIEAAEAFIQRRRRELKAKITAIRRKRKTSPKKQQGRKPMRPETQAALHVPADSREIKALSVLTYPCRHDRR